VWRADGHGPFQTGDGLYGDPLTVADGYSRFLLGCQALSSTRVAEAKPVFTRLFKEFGLPKRLRTDNGVPFATNTLGRLSPLSAWWVRLGIFPELIEPGKPQQHGRHERRHRPLTAATTRPPARSRRAQQRTCDRCREELNGQRPHEALAMPPPASCDAPSPRQRPTSLPPLAYPDRFEGRDVRAHGGLRWHHQGVNVSPTCMGEDVGREDIDDGLWQVSCGPLTRGRLLARHLRSADVDGRLPRHR
jgi:putative transposase